jgi:hypothetical protein
MEDVSDFLSSSAACFAGALAEKLTVFCGWMARESGMGSSLLDLEARHGGVGTLICRSESSVILIMAAFITRDPPRE